MRRLPDPSHLAGLTLSAGLIAALWAYWPWPFGVLRVVAPALDGAIARSWLADYRTLIGGLSAVVVLSIIHVAWNRAVQRRERPDDEA